jgi:hypothetical protein
VALALGALAAQGNGMNESSIQLWQWLRHDRSISVCRIDGIGVEPAGDDEIVRVRLATVETLWGPKAADERRASFQRPVSPLVRLKVQIRVWGRVELQPGNLLLYVTDGPETEAEALFAGNTSADDPALAAVRQVVSFERDHAGDADARKSRYVEWLGKGRLLQRLFAGEALSRDSLPGNDRDARVATAMAGIVGDDSAAPFLRISALEWLNAHVWPVTSPAGKAAAIRGEARALSAGDANVRQFAYDALIDLDPVRIREQGIIDTTAAALLRKHAAAPDAPGRARLQALANALTRRP